MLGVFMLSLANLSQVGAPPAPPVDVQREPPPLVVQVVDPAWYPIEGAVVTVTVKKGGARLASGRTDKAGQCSFWLASEIEYVVEAVIPGFEAKRTTGVSLVPHDDRWPTAFVQLRLELPKGPTSVE